MMRTANAEEIEPGVNGEDAIELCRESTDLSRIQGTLAPSVLSTGLAPNCGFFSRLAVARLVNAGELTDNRESCPIGTAAAIPIRKLALVVV